MGPVKVRVGLESLFKGEKDRFLDAKLDVSDVRRYA